MGNGLVKYTGKDDFFCYDMHRIFSWDYFVKNCVTTRFELPQRSISSDYCASVKVLFSQ